MSIRNAFFGDDYQVSSGEIINEDEEILALTEAMEDLKEAEIINGDINRLMDISDSLESLCQVAANSDDPKAIDLCYIETATEACLAGTDVAVEEVLPSMEDYTDDIPAGVTVATERIGEMIKNIWRTILNYIKKLWTRIKKFFASIFKTIPRLKKSAESLKERADKIGSKTAEDNNVEIGRTAGVLSVQGNVVSSAGDVINYLTDYNIVSDLLLIEGPKVLLKIGESLNTSISNMSGGNGPKTTDLIEMFTKADITGTDGKISKFLRGAFARPLEACKTLKESTKVTRSDRFPNSRHIITRDILASRTLVVKTGSSGNDDVNRDIRVVSNYGMELVMTDTDSSFEMPKEGEVSIFSVVDCKNIADQVLELCDVITKYHAGKTKKEIEKVKAKLEKSTSKVSKTLEKKKDDPEDPTVAKNWRAVCNINKIWSNDWTTMPHAVWQGHAVTVCRASIDACNKSLSKYK